MDRQYKHSLQKRQSYGSVDGFVNTRGRDLKYKRTHATNIINSGRFEANPEDITSTEPQVEEIDLSQIEVMEQEFSDFNMSLPGESRRIKKKSNVRHCFWCALRIWTLRAVTAAVIIAIGLGGLLFSQGYWKAHKVFRGETNAVALQKNVDPNLLKGEGDGRVNILLLGIGGGDHDGPDLTDTIIIASIDPVNKTAALVSVPRDMWVDLPGYGKMKINAAYETGKYAYLHKIDSSNANHDAVAAGLSMADRTIEQVTGINIHYNVLADFQAFRQAIDTVGGVQVNVTQQLYDPTMAWENNNNPVLAQVGLQTFDGKHALNFVRSRETSTDFARSERQRTVLVALKEKIMTLGTLSNPLKISQLINDFGDNVQSDLSLGDVGRLVSLMKDTNNDSIKSIGFADPPNNYVVTDHVGNQSVVRPSAGFFNYSAIQKYLRGILVDGYISKENANITVLNGTNTQGLASEKANDLKSYGYNVGTVGYAPSSNYQNTMIIDLTGGKDKYTRHYLEERYGVSAVSSIPAGSSLQAGQADFIIVLGNDETFSSKD